MLSRALYAAPGNRFLALAALIAMILEAACTHLAPRPIPAIRIATEPAALVEGTRPSAESVHYGRYTLITMAPEPEQDDLLTQVIDLHIPPSAGATVADAMRYVLLRSGYQLCEDPHIRNFETLPLPAAHMHLGPLTLSNALQLLAGRGWQLKVDEMARRVCFIPRVEAASDGRSADSTQLRGPIPAAGAVTGAAQ